MVRRLWHVSCWVVVLVATALLLAAVLVPRVAGATPYTVLTGSMKPDLPPGTLVVARPVAPDEIGIGSVVTYQVSSGQPVVVTHRVVSQGIGQDGQPVFLTQGDANDAPDETWVQVAQVRGEVWYAVPYLGYLSELFSQSQRELGVSLVAGTLLLYAIREFLGAARERRPGPRHRGAAHV